MDLLKITENILRVWVLSWASIPGLFLLSYVIHPRVDIGSDLVLPGTVKTPSFSVVSQVFSDASDHGVTVWTSASGPPTSSRRHPLLPLGRWKEDIPASLPSPLFCFLSSLYDSKVTEDMNHVFHLAWLWEDYSLIKRPKAAGGHPTPAQDPSYRFL